MPGNENLVADALGTFAVAAGSGHITWGLDCEPLGVHGGGHGSGPGHGVLQGGANLIHSRNHNHGFRAIYNSGHPVAGTVDIHQFPVQAQGIGSGEEHIRQQRLLHDLCLFLRGLCRVPVNGTVIAIADGIDQPHFLSGDTAAPAYAGPFRDQTQGLTEGVLLCGAVVSVKVAAAEVLQNHLGTLFITGFFHVIHRVLSFIMYHVPS